MLKLEGPKIIDKGIIHQIKWGDTLSGIALKYGAKMDDIVRANGIKNPDKIYAGQKLIIPR